ncbi:PTS sugar transporter subunit IIA [Faecalicoccus pleomorphus]|uniref:PTS transporter subunit EIIA n=1 Tax=Faecalicoccus pleomorphus TaxID=1323 RepID=A0A7X9RHS9_9FIRM|nr:fructose PTS transporter subunit IIA [Faecalicoccus pleomorphus]MBM6765495.1 PTS sugar transporter subunit IIA [Faecalicoccus pleomorphus]MBM6809301.1 PTS sugar transporter subunit IIA [Faecalicoccus pleomorphus]NME45250.1 PTS transporter subunit EIIA [Faecalicoccus pleomorphus]
MEIKDIIDTKIMGVDLEGITKDDAINVMAQILFDAGYINDLQSYKDDIYYRETLGKTGIGNYIAIPHGLSKSVVKNGIAIGKFKNEIPWESIDGKGVRVVCLFSVQDGDNAGNEHLKMLATIAGKLADDDVVQTLLDARTVEDIAEAFLEH